MIRLKTDPRSGPRTGMLITMKIKGKLTAPELPKFEDPVAAAAPPPPEEKEDPFLNIAPKKPNWDLRRDVQKKLDKLERRMQKALYKIMAEQEKQRELENRGAAAED